MDENTAGQKSNIFIKIIFPIISSLLVLLGLIILYQAGNVNQYITDEIRIGFGYTLSLGLLAGYFFDKVRSTVFSQILLSVVLSSLTLTTIIATHGYHIFSQVIGAFILLILFLVGLFLAHRHTSEIEFSTSALIGICIPLFYPFESFFAILSIEVIIIGSLYIFLHFFKRVQFLHTLVFAAHLVISVIVGVQYTLYFNDFNYDVALYVYELLQLTILAVPIFYRRKKFVTEKMYKVVLIVAFAFTTVSAFPFILCQVETTQHFHIHALIIYSIIAGVMMVHAYYFRKIHSFQLFSITSGLSYATFCIAIVLFFDTFSYMVSTLLVFTMVFLYMLSCLTKIEVEKTAILSIMLERAVYVFAGLLLLPMLFNILAFIGSFTITQPALFRDRFIPPTILLISFWIFTFSFKPNVLFTINKRMAFYGAWFITAAYFIYMPWQLLGAIFSEDNPLPLILLSIMWGVAAYGVTLVAIKQKRGVLRIFTMAIVSVLLCKFILVDFPTFIKPSQALLLAFYTIGFGIFSLILSRIMIKEFNQNSDVRILSEFDKYRQERMSRLQEAQAIKREQLRQQTQQRESPEVQTQAQFIPSPVTEQQPAQPINSEITQKQPVQLQEVKQGSVQDTTTVNNATITNEDVSIAQSMLGLLRNQHTLIESQIRLQESTMKEQQLQIGKQKKILHDIQVMMYKLEK